MALSGSLYTCQTDEWHRLVAMFQQPHQSLKQGGNMLGAGRFDCR